VWGRPAYGIAHLTAAHFSGNERPRLNAYLAAQNWNQ
jgi:hypothetical protein